MRRYVLHTCVIMPNFDFVNFTKIILWGNLKDIYWTALKCSFLVQMFRSGSVLYPIYTYPNVCWSSWKEKCKLDWSRYMKVHLLEPLLYAWVPISINYCISIPSSVKWDYKSPLLQHRHNSPSKAGVPPINFPMVCPMLEVKNWAMHVNSLFDHVD